MDTQIRGFAIKKNSEIKQQPQVKKTKKVTLAIRFGEKDVPLDEFESPETPKCNFLSPAQRRSHTTSKLGVMDENKTPMMTFYSPNKTTTDTRKKWSFNKSIKGSIKSATFYGKQLQPQTSINKYSNELTINDSELPSDSNRLFAYSPLESIFSAPNTDCEISNGLPKCKSVDMHKDAFSKSKLAFPLIFFKRGSLKLKTKLLEFKQRGQTIHDIFKNEPEHYPRKGCSPSKKIQLLKNIKQKPKTALTKIYIPQRDPQKQKEEAKKLFITSTKTVPKDIALFDSNKLQRTCNVYGELKKRYDNLRQQMISRKNQEVTQQNTRIEKIWNKIGFDQTPFNYKKTIESLKKVQIF